MVEDSATRFPPSFYSPPSSLSSVAAPSTSNINLSLPFLPSSSNSSPDPNLSTSPPPQSNSAINLRLGNYEVGTGGLYRTSGTNGAPTLSIDSNKVKEGLSNGLAGASAGAMSLVEKIRQGVEARRVANAAAAAQAAGGGRGGQGV